MNNILIVINRVFSKLENFIVIQSKGLKRIPLAYNTLLMNDRGEMLLKHNVFRVMSLKNISGNQKWE